MGDIATMSATTVCVCVLYLVAQQCPVLQDPMD